MSDGFERAVLVCLNPAGHSGEDHARALETVSAAASGPDAPRFALSRLTPAARPELAFWCLQVLHAAPSPAARPQVLAYAAAVVGVSSSTPAPPYVRNKLAQVIVAHIAAEYPETWPGSMREFVLPLATDERARTPASLDLFFRIMRTLDSEVTSIVAAQSSESARQTSIRVKDAIRDDCATALVQLLAALVHVPAYADHAYDLVARNVEWLDIGLFANDTFLPAMYAAITSPSPCRTRAASAYALRCLILKRMPMQAKHALFQHLQILQLLAAVPSSIPDDDDAASGIMSAAELGIQTGQNETAMLVNSILNIALDLLKTIIAGAKKAAQPFMLDASLVPIVQTAGEVAEAALPLALRFVSADMDETLSAEILNGVTAYINVFGRLNALENQHVANGNRGTDSGNGMAGSAPHSGRGRKSGDVLNATTDADEEVVWTKGRNGLVATLQVLEDRACFPPGYDPTDDDESFASLRRVLLGKVLQGIARGVPSMVLSFVQRIAADPATSLSYGKTELVLTVLNLLAATGRQVPGLSETLMGAMANPPTFSYPGQPTTVAVARQLDAVHLAHRELVVRCYRLVIASQDPAFLASVLAPFFDQRGLMHPSSSALRSRSIYLLLRLTRSLRTVIASQHLSAVMSAIHPLMFPIHPHGSGQLFDDQMNLFELAGYLIGSDASSAESSKYLASLLSTIVDALRSVSNSPQRVGVVTAAGQLSKGFGGDSKPILFAGPAEGSPPTSPGATVSHGVANGLGKSCSPPRVNGAPNVNDVKAHKPKPLPEQALAMWRACLEAVLVSVGLMGTGGAVLSVPPSNLDDDIKEKTVFILHRMVDTMGVSVIPYLGFVVPLLLQSSTSPAEVRSVAVLISQAVGKFGSSCVEVMMPVFPEVVARVFRFPPVIDPSTMMAMSEEARECVELRKAYYYCVHAILGSNAQQVLIGKQNPMLLPNVVSTILDGFAGRDVDLRAAPTIMKMCGASLIRMLTLWVSPVGMDVLSDFREPKTGLPRSFAQFMVDELGMACPESLVSSAMFRGGDYSNGAAIAFISENISLQTTCATRLGPVFGESLRRRGFARLQQAPVVEAYVKALYEPNAAPQTLSKMFISAVKSLRS